MENGYTLYKHEVHTRELFCKEQLAQRYGIGTRTVDNWMKNKIIPYFKIQHVVRFDPDACDAAIEKFKVKSIAVVGGRTITPSIALPTVPQSNDERDINNKSGGSNPV